MEDVKGGRSASLLIQPSLLKNVDRNGRVSKELGLSTCKRDCASGTIKKGDPNTLSGVRVLRKTPRSYGPWKRLYQTSKYERGGGDPQEPRRGWTQPTKTPLGTTRNRQGGKKKKGENQW